MSWIVDRAGWYFSLGRPRRITSAIDSGEEERSLNYIFHDPALEANPRSLISVLGTMPDNLVDILDTAVQACRAKVLAAVPLKTKKGWARSPNSARIAFVACSVCGSSP